MTQAERGLFEQLEQYLNPGAKAGEEAERIIREFEQQLHYLGGTVEVLSADKEALEQRLAEAERVKSLLSDELFGELYEEQDRRMRLNKRDDDYLPVDDTQLGLEFAFKFISQKLTAPLPEKKHE